jgi:transposase InsO family protein
MRGKDIVLTGERKDDTLYHLDLEPDIQTTRKDKQTSAELSLYSAHGADIRASLITWHKRLGHLGYQMLLKILRQDLAVGLNIDGDCEIPASLCSACETGKFTRVSLKEGRHRAGRIGELTHSDVWGPIASPSLGGATYYVTFKDDFSGHLTVYFMKRKSEVPSLIRLYHATLLNETGNYMLTLRTDNGKGEYVNNENDAWFKEKGIRHETSAPYTPEQNGTAERTNRTLLDIVRCMLISSGLPSSLWAEAVSYATYIRNRVLSRTGELTPYHYWNGKKPDLSKIRIFGSRAFIRDPLVSSKLEARSQEGVFVGRSITQNAFRIYIPSTKRILISKDVKVDETMVYHDMKKQSVSTFFSPNL